MHNQCVNEIILALNRHATIRATIQCCHNCKQRISNDIYLAEGDVCERDYEGDSSLARVKFDIRIINSANQIKWGIEVYNFHTTSTFDHKRINYNWIELDVGCHEKMTNAKSGDVIECDDIRYMCRNCSALETTSLVEIRQQGAGSGKTFNLLKCIPKYLEYGKRVFIYTSKTSSAIGTLCGDYWKYLFEPRNESERESFHEVADSTMQMSEEFEEFKEKGFDIIGKDAILCDNQRINRRLRCLYYHDIPFVVIFCTIDSLISGIYNESIGTTIEGDRDIFTIKANQIAKHDWHRLTMDKWLGVWRKKDQIPIIFRRLCAQDYTHIFIDEAQDINACYAAALGQFARKGIGLTIVGDGLQAVYDTRINRETGRAVSRSSCQSQNIIGHAMELVDPTHSKLSQYYPTIFDDAHMIVKSSNKVRRCIHPTWPTILSELVDFKKAHLQPPRGVKLEKASTSDSKNNPIIEIVQVQQLRYNKEKTLCNILQRYYEKGYVLPKNYTLLLPYVTTGDASTLENIAQVFWEKHCDVSKHQNVSKHGLFVMRHMSQEGEPIDITKSEDLMRIMSIHASKGSGREVVIWWGADDRILRNYDTNRDDIISRSLCHVALTRHREKLVLVIGDTSPMYVKLAELSKKYPAEIQFADPGNVDPVKNLLFTPLKRTESIKCNRKRYNTTFSWVIEHSGLEWSGMEQLFSRYANQLLSGKDMTSQIIQSALLETYANMFCWINNPSLGAKKLHGTSTHNVGIIALLLSHNQENDIIFEKVNDDETYSKKWHNLFNILHAKQFNWTGKLPSIAIRSAALLNMINEKKHDGRTTPQYLIALSNELNGSLKSRKEKLELVCSRGRIELILLMYYIFQNAHSNGYGNISENDITRTLTELRNIRMSGDVTKLDNTLKLLETSQPLLGNIMHQGDKIFTHADLYSEILVDKSSHGDLNAMRIRANQRTFIVASEDGDHLYLVVITPKIDELNFLDTIASAFIACRCIYIHNIHQEQTYIKPTTKFGIRFVVLNSDTTQVSSTTNGLILVDDELVTQYVKTSTSDDDIIRMFDEQINVLFEQIRIGAVYLHKFVKSDDLQAAYRKLIEIAKSSCQTTYIGGNHKFKNDMIFGYLLSKQSKIIKHIQANNLNALDQIRDKLIVKMRRRWMSTINSYLEILDSEDILPANMGDGASSSGASSSGTHADVCAKLY